MKGVGHSSAAISFLNALFCDIGAAGSIALPVTARVEIGARREKGPTKLQIPSSADSPLVRASLLIALAQYSTGGGFNASLELDSKVPVGAGLKSSSAVSTAVIQGTARACRVEPPYTEIAALSARVSRDIGLSATGAFDDALACISGGCVVTDNLTPRVFRAGACDLPGRVVVWVPTGSHPPSSSLRDAFRAKADEARPALEAAMSGRLLEAMERNGRLVESVMKYDYRSARSRLSELGAQAAGVSGLGPALAVVVPGRSVPQVRDFLRSLGGQVVSTRFQPARRLPSPGAF